MTCQCKYCLEDYPWIYGCTDHNDSSEEEE